MRLTGHQAVVVWVEKRTVFHGRRKAASCEISCLIKSIQASATIHVCALHALKERGVAKDSHNCDVRRGVFVGSNGQREEHLRGNARLCFSHTGLCARVPRSSGSVTGRPLSEVWAYCVLVVRRGLRCAVARASHSCSPLAQKLTKSAQQKLIAFSRLNCSPAHFMPAVHGDADLGQIAGWPIEARFEPPSAYTGELGAYDGEHLRLQPRAA